MNIAASSSRTRPLTDLTVALIHPAWDSCGTATVVASQARAYRELGAKVLSVALSEQPFGLAPNRFTQAYLKATPELVADRRLLVGMRLGTLLNPFKIASLGLRFAHGDQASTYVALAENTSLPADLIGSRIDLVHCNHFFCMPLARLLREAQHCPVVLDTHDMQARQYELRNAGTWCLPPRTTFAAMLSTELAALRQADLLIHLNSDEEAAFRELLPESRHTLLYPAVDSMPTAPGGDDLVIVASANVPNILSLEWFLRDVMPLTGDLPLAIYGNVDAAIRGRNPRLYGRYSRHFRGRIDAIGVAYAGAAAVLLPTIEGHGLSIKTLEALSSGAPLIATRQAFRGIDIDPASLGNVTIADDAVAFAAALREVFDRPLDKAARQSSPTRRLYEARFSPAAYQRGLAQHVSPLLGSQSRANA